MPRFSLPLLISMGGCCSIPLINCNTDADHNTVGKVETEYQVDKCNDELNSLFQAMIHKFEDNKEITNAVFKRRLSRVISSVIVSDPVRPRSLSLNSLREAADEIQFLNNETVHKILKFKDDFIQNPELRSFVEDYVKNSSRTLKFFETIKHCLRKAHKIESVVQDAIFCFREKNYAITVEKLKEFSALEDPFSNEFIDELKLVTKTHKDMLMQLESMELAFEDKFQTLKVRKKLWTIMYQSSFAMTLICSVVLAAVSAPPAAAAAVAATATAFQTIGQFCDAIWNHYQALLSQQQEIVGIMGMNTGLPIKELQDIRAIVNDLQQQVGSIQKTYEFRLEEEDEIKVKLAMRNIEEKVKEFSKLVKDLDNKVNKCTQNVSNINEKICKVITEGESTGINCKETFTVCCGGFLRALS